MASWYAADKSDGNVWMIKQTRSQGLSWVLWYPACMKVDESRCLSDMSLCRLVMLRLKALLRARNR